MLENKKNLIITLADGNYIKQAKQLFSSVFYNAGWEGDYMLLTNGLGREDKDWFESRGIIVYEPPLFSDKPLGARGYPPILLSKLNFFQESFKKWQKLIFLDADIIVKASLNRLLELKGFNAPMATCFRLRNEFSGDIVKSKEFKNKYNLNRLAFNSGVFIFDTDIIDSNTYNNLIHFYEKYKDIAELGEESILNLFFYDKWKLLPMIYNSTPDYMKKYFGIGKNKLVAIIIHFVCAPIKPWNPKSEYYEEWSENLQRADKINLSKRPEAAKVYSDWKLNRYAKYLKGRKITYFLRIFFFFVDRKIGRIGLLIKKIYPSLYNLIRIKKDE